MNFRTWSSIQYDEARALVVHDDGDVEIEHLVLEKGRKVKGGTAFEVGDSELDAMVRNHEADAAAGYLAPIFLGHPRERDQAPRVGRIESLKRTAAGLVARLRFLGDFAKRIARKEFTELSPTFTFKAKGERGEDLGAKVFDVGVLNVPFQKALGPLSIPAAAVGLGWVPAGEAHALSEVFEGDHEELIMAEGNVTMKLELSEEVRQAFDDVSEKLTTFSDRIAALEEAATKPAELVTDDAATLKLTEERDAAVRANDERDVADLLKKALDTGKLTPAQVEQFGTDDFKPLEWLEASQFGGVAGLRQHVMTAPPVVDLGDRNSSGSGDGKGSDYTALARGIHSAVPGSDLAEIEKSLAAEMAE